MANEKRLIDANAFWNRLNNVVYDIFTYPERPCDYARVGYYTETIETVLKQAKTVDAVEVVRCKDCKWYNRNEDIMPQSGSCEFHEMVKMDWDFCSRAKMDGDGNGNL